MTLATWLEALEAAGLIRAARATAEPEYRFRHALVQEAAYASLLRSDRRRLHAWVGEILAAQGEDPRYSGGGSGAQAAVLGHHFREAGEWVRARAVFAQAGQYAAQHGALPEAIQHFTDALHCLVREPAYAPGALDIDLTTGLGRALELNGAHTVAMARYEALEALGRASGEGALELAGVLAQARLCATPSPLFDPERAQVLCTRAQAVAVVRGDEVAEARVLWLLSLMHLTRIEVAPACEYGARALVLARASDDRELLAFVLTDLSRAYSLNDRHAESVALAQEAEGLWRALDNRPMLAQILLGGAAQEYHERRFENARAQFLEVRALNHSINNFWGEANTITLFAEMLIDLGELGAAYRYLEEGVLLAERGGFVMPSVNARYMLAWICVQYGAYARALTFVAEAFEAAVGALAYLRPRLLGLRMYVELTLGQVAEAEVTAREAVVLLGERGTIYIVLEISRARLDLLKQNYEEAHACFAALLTALGELQNAWRAELWYWRARGALARESWAEARTALAEARAVLGTVTVQNVLWRVALAEAEVAERTGDVACVPVLRAEARAHVQAMLDDAPDAALRAALLALPAVRQLMDVRVPTE